MKLTIERAALLSALSHVQSVVERRNTIPILSNVLLETSSTTLNLTATDLDIALVDKAPAKVGQNGATTVPAHILYDIVRKLPDGADVELSMKAGDQKLILRAGRSDFSLACLPKDDFPTMAAGDLSVRFQITANELRQLIDRTSFAISTEETRYYLNGIYLHAAQSGGVAMLRAVATDGHRLARVEVPLPEGAAGMPGLIVSRKTVNELRKLLDAAEGAVQVSLSDTKIRFVVDQTMLTSKLIDGTFPDYERVIPVNNKKALDVDPKTLEQAVDRVSTISSEKSRAVKLALEKDRLTVSATSAEQGSGSEELSAIYGGDAMEIGFNARYLIDILKQVEGDTAKLLFDHADSPTLLRDGAEDGALYVLMPMRV